MATTKDSGAASEATTPRPITPKTWDAIWADYRQGNSLDRVTFAALAEAHGVSAKTIGRHVRVHHWKAKRRADYVREMLQEVEPDFQRNLRASRRAVARLAPLLRGENLPAIRRAAEAASRYLGRLDFLAGSLTRFRAEAARTKP